MAPVSGELKGVLCHVLALGGSEEENILNLKAELAAVSAQQTARLSLQAVTCCLVYRLPYAGG